MKITQQTKAKRVILQLQTILQHFYKLLMWQILINFNLGPTLILHFYVLIII